MKTVLIADDAAFMRAKLKAMIERSGYQVVGEAENGKEAVLKYFELKPDLVTMDITMPSMDGLTALKEIRKRDPKSNIVIVSAMGQEATVREAILAGARSFIVKPFNEGQIIETLNKLLNK